MLRFILLEGLKIEHILIKQDLIEQNWWNLKSSTLGVIILFKQRLKGYKKLIFHL